MENPEITVNIVLLLLALLCFVVAAFGGKLGDRVSLTPLGLAFFVLSMVV